MRGPTDLMLTAAGIPDRRHMIDIYAKSQVLLFIWFSPESFGPSVAHSLQYGSNPPAVIRPDRPLLRRASRAEQQRHRSDGACR